jgi:tetratricopeptide (TPR) repeat protein
MVGKMLSHYQLVEKIGEGGMGVVWKAEDTVLGRTVAIKVLPADVALDAERRQLFLNEARLAASLSHAHIVQVHDLGREGDLDFIVMEFVEGQPLSRLLHGHALPPEKVASLGLQIAEGLSRAHHKKLLHRDLKPGNVLVTPEGEVKIVDFGLATLFAGLESTLASSTVPLADAAGSGQKTGSIVGTLPYMSPEQVRGEKPDARSDIFSFGTVLYEMTTGRRPFNGNTPAEVAQEILRSQPTPAHELAPKVPLDLLRIIEKALARKPEDRYQILDDAAVDLRRLMKEIESGSWPSFADMQRPPKPKKRHPWLRVAFPMAVLLAAAGAWIARDRWTQGHRQQAASGTSVDRKTPRWILVADFETPGVDSTLVDAVRELVVASLEQSHFVVPIPRSQLQRGLEITGKPPRTRVVGEEARELAYRVTGARGVYVAGRVAQVLQGHSVALQLIRTEDGQVLVSKSGVAENEELLIPTVDRLCRDLRSEIGERKRDLPGSMQAWSMTPSFEALRLAVQAGELHGRLDWAGSNRLLRRALVLDPDFATAWASMFYNYQNMGMLDSAQTALNEALRRPTRLTELQRMRLECWLAYNVQCDYAEALKLADLGSSHFPDDPGLQQSRAFALGGMGRYEEAYDAYVREAELMPFGPSQTNLSNQCEYLMVLGRYEEARQVAKGLVGGRRQLVELTLRLSSSNWAGAESLATGLQDDPTANPRDRFIAQVALASLPVIRGAAATSARALEELPDQAFNPAWAYIPCLARLHLWIASARGVERPTCESCTDTTTAGLIVQGIRAAALGDLMTARRHLTTIKARPTPDGRHYAVEIRLLEGWIAAIDGDWDRVIRLLEPSITQGQTPLLTGRFPVRWLVAEAEERLGRLEAAAATYDQVLSPLRSNVRWIGQEECARAIYWPFAHQRLVIIYAKLGKAEEARQHWSILERTFTQPDSELVPLVEQARKAIEGLKSAS